MQPSFSFRQIQIEDEAPEETNEQEVVVDEQASVDIQEPVPQLQVEEKKPEVPFSFRAVEQPIQSEEAIVEKDSSGFKNAFKRGLNRSASGEVGNLVFGTKPDETPMQDPSFWESVVEESGNLIGDAPYMAIGGTIGSVIGGSLGSSVPVVGTAIGSAAGGSFGALAIPAFLKEASRQYRDFQDKGGDLTFGEFLQRADQVANRTLNEGMFGVILGATGKSIDLLNKIPAVKQLFDTRYIGGLTKTAGTIAAETGVATGVPAIAEQRMPTKEDAARAAVLFAGGRLAHLPGQLYDNIKESKSKKFNYALADKIKKLDLAYPPIQEFKSGENPVYKNSVELDRNLTTFDQSYMENIISKINSISDVEFSSAHEAGKQMKDQLAPLTAVKIPEPITPEAEPVNPVNRPVPLVSNPLEEVMKRISNNAASSKADLGRRITYQYEVGRHSEKVPLDQRFESQRKELTGIDIVDPSLVSEIESFARQFEYAAIPGSAAERIVKNADKLVHSLAQFDEEGSLAGYTSAPIQQIIDINRSIKQIPNWDVPPEMLDNLNTLTRMIDQSVTGHLTKTNPMLAEEFTNLNQDYAAFKNRWDNNDMRIFYDRTENSEAVYNQFKHLDNFLQLEQALGGDFRGDKVLNLIRREVWNDGIGRNAIRARTEGEFENATRDLTMRKLRDLSEYLTPEQREIAMQSMNHSNQIRTSAIRASESFSEKRSVYEKEMEQWIRREDSRRKKEVEQRRLVQDKQDLLVSLLQEDPAALVGNMKTIEGIKRMREATKKVEKGNELFDSLARYETEQMFNFMRNEYMKTGRVPYTQMKIRMNDKEFRAKLKELNGDKFTQDVDELVSVADKLSKNFKEKVVEYKDDPTTLNTILHIYSLLGLANGDIMTPLMAFTVKKNMLKMSGKAYSLWSNKNNYNQEYIHKTLEAAKAINKRYNNKKQIREKGSRLNIPLQSP